MALQEETSAVTLKAGLVSNTAVLAALPSQVLHATWASFTTAWRRAGSVARSLTRAVSHPPLKMQ